jgi:hypothetical protein
MPHVRLTNGLKLDNLTDYGKPLTVLSDGTVTTTEWVSGGYDASLRSEVEAISANLQAQIDSIDISGANTSQFGIIECDTITKSYHISHTYVDVNYTAPQVSLTIPSNSSALYVQGITNRDNYGFDVILSSVPMVSGYKINWLINNPGGTIVIDNTIVVNTYTGTGVSGTVVLDGQYTAYDLTIIGNITMSEPINMISGQPIIVKITQSGINTITWNSAFKFQDGVSATLTPTNNVSDIFTITKFGNYYYVGGIQNFT